jgi:hypothetical protein
MNGRIYEAVKALQQQRQRLDLYHTALQLKLPEGHYVVETMWPQPDGDLSSRGVVAEAPVFAEWLSFTRVFRYEVRCWQRGDLPDAGEAVGGPRQLSDDPKTARRLLLLTESVPTFTWGRDPMNSKDMWNSNSVISWLITQAGLPIDNIQPPGGGRAPGWDAGVLTAQRGPGISQHSP